MSVKEIVIKHLKEIGADGLYGGSCPNEPCGCGVDDLVPCNHDFSDCVPAIRRRPTLAECIECCHDRVDPEECGEDCRFYYPMEKPECLAETNNTDCPIAGVGVSCRRARWNSEKDLPSMSIFETR